MDDFPGNTHSRQAPAKLDPEKKVVERVTKGPVKKARESLGRKFLKVFVGGDAKGVLEYILVEVLVPALKDAFVEAATQGIERTLFGESRQNRRSSTYRPQTNYSSYSRTSYSQPRREEPRQAPRNRSSASSYQELSFMSRSDADLALEGMYCLLEKYGRVTVADLYELAGLTSYQFTDQKWGWEVLDGTSIRRYPDGYRLDLVPPEPLN